MKQKPLLAVALLLIVFVFGCQPTPDSSAIVYKGEGLPDDCMIAPVSDTETKEINMPSHWEEETERADGWVRFTADIDLEAPVINNTPVIEYKQRVLTNEGLSKLVRYFAGDRKLYVYPEFTKTEWEFQSEQIINKNGFYINPGVNMNSASMLARIDKEVGEASEDIKKEYVKPTFSSPLEDQYYYMITGDEKDVAKDEEYSFLALVETDNEYDPFIKSTTYNIRAGSSSDFTYQKGAYLSADDIYKYYWVNESFRGTEHDVYNPVSIEQQNRLDDYYKSMQEYLDKSGDPSSETHAVADKILSDLNVENMICTGVYKCIALNMSSRRWDVEFDEQTASIAYEFKYALSPTNKMNCYVPQKNRSIVFSEEATPEEVYKPSFGTEEITIVVADNEVYAFSWKNMSEQVGLIAENTALLDFEQCKEKALDHLGYEVANSIGIPPEGAERTYIYKYDAQNVELGYYNITAYDKPDHVWAVPAWIFNFDIYVRTYDPKTYLANGEASEGGATVLINALDGAYISMENQLEYK